MHVRELVDLAALIAVNGSALVRRAGRLSTAGLEAYWTASKCRQDRWGRALADYTQRLRQSPPPQRPQLWLSVRPVIEEVIVSEMLTRIWTAVACGYDRRQQVREIEPIARSIFMGHLESRMRVLNLIVYGCGVAAQEAVALNKLRRRCEKWTDMLLAFLHEANDFGEFAFDAQRAREFAADSIYETPPRAGTMAWELLLVSLRGAFRQDLSLICPNADLHGRVAAAVLNCFEEELQDAAGLLQPLWMLRLAAAADHTQSMIDELLEPWESF